jgi:hypothetical protein
MSMRINKTRLANGLMAAFAAVMLVGQAQAATFDLSLSGTTAGFSETPFDFGGTHFDSFFLPLTGLDATNAITVSQGDVINATVTLDGSYTVPASQIRTDLLLYLFGSSFPAENTGVDGTMTFFNGGAVVASFGFSSTTSSQLSAFAALFPPNNGAITFDSFTDNLTITALATPAILDSAAFNYDLLSSAAPEPASWALMMLGVGGMGACLRTRRRKAVAL